VKQFLQRFHGAVGRDPVVIKKIGHLPLPALIFLALCHRRTGALKIFTLEIAHEQPILPQE
jgi:hypothetical protein